MFLGNGGSIHRPRGLSVLYCPFSDGTPMRIGVAKLQSGVIPTLHLPGAKERAEKRLKAIRRLR
jgi:hypothetical protein